MARNNKKQKFEAGEVFAEYGWPGSTRLELNLARGNVTREEVERAKRIAEQQGAKFEDDDQDSGKLVRKRKTLPYKQVSNLLGMKEEYEERGDEEGVRAIDRALEQRDMQPIADRREEVLMRAAQAVRRRREEARKEEDEQEQKQPMVFGAMEGQDSADEQEYIRKERERSKEARRKALEKMRGY